MKVNPYLNFDGKAEEAFLFYKSIFGGEFIAHMKMSDAPDMNDLSKEEMNRVMHISLPLGKDTILMGSDILPSAGHSLNIGNNVYVSIHPESREEADRIFASLSKGGGTLKCPWRINFGAITLEALSIDSVSDG